MRDVTARKMSLSLLNTTIHRNIIQHCQADSTGEMCFKQSDSGFSDSSDSLDLSHIVNTLKKDVGKTILKDFNSNRVTFYSVSDMIKDKSFDFDDNLLEDDLADIESADKIFNNFLINDKQDKENGQEDLDCLDYCDFQNNEFPTLEPHYSCDQPIKTITNSNRTATSQFPENSSLRRLPCQVTPCPLSSALSTLPGMNHKVPETGPNPDDHLQQHLNTEHLDCMDNPLDASQHSSKSSNSSCVRDNRYKRDFLLVDDIFLETHN